MERENKAWSTGWSDLSNLTPKIMSSPKRKRENNALSLPDKRNKITPKRKKAAREPKGVTTPGPSTVTTAALTATLTDTRPSAPSAEGTLVAASTPITSDANTFDENEIAALVKVTHHTAYENCDPSPLKTANTDRTLAIANPALDNPHLPRNRDFRGKTENHTQHILANALIHHAITWYHDHGGIDAVVHQLDDATLTRLCYEEGAFSTWVTERLTHEAICDRFPQPMLQGVPGKNQAARSMVYTIRSKIP